MVEIDKMDIVDAIDYLSESIRHTTFIDSALRKAVVSVVTEIEAHAADKEVKDKAHVALLLLRIA